MTEDRVVFGAVSLILAYGAFVNVVFEENAKMVRVCSPPQAAAPEPCRD